LRRRSYSSSELSGAEVMSTGSSAVRERRICPSLHRIRAYATMGR
jgi:hypothetical protein